MRKGDLMEFLETVLERIVGFAILMFELTGVGVIIWSGVTGVGKYVRHRADTKLALASGLATGLEFKLGSEILRTVVVRQWQEIALVAGIIALRAALTVLIHWEIREEERQTAGEEERLSGAAP